MKYMLPHDHGQNTQLILQHMPQVEEFQKTSNLFAQLSDSTRLRIFWLLCHSEECVCNIAAAMNMSNPAVSHHLRLLKASGLATSRREGKEVYYKSSENQEANLLHNSLDSLLKITCPKK